MPNCSWGELGGMQDSIAYTEIIQDELLKIALGVREHIKNHGVQRADNCDLE